MKLLPGLCAGALAITLIACAGSSGDDREGPEIAEERSFPTFEPFRASRMANFVFSEGMPGDEASGEDSLEEFLRTGEVFRVEQMSAGEGAERDALFDLSIWERSWAVMVPVAISKLKPVWRKARASEAWTQEDCDLAKMVAALIERAPHSWTPLNSAPSFHVGQDEANAIALDALFDWYEARAHEPACMGAMIATMDDGPWTAPDWRRSRPSTVMDSRRIGKGLEVRILLVEDDAPWCLQALRDGKVLWTKHLTRIPTGSFAFTEKAPTRLGPYGTKIHLSFGEYCHAYLGPEGEFLFYFTSW
ncbi:MAG: hypothetical protein AAF368_03900 [Planctomycetota bacterium]